MISSAAAERFLGAPWLFDLDSTSRYGILNVLEEVRVPAGAVLLEQGQPNDRIRFLLEGTVTVTRTYPVAHEERVATLHGPAIFGEISFFRPSPPVVTVRAQTPCWLLTLDRHGHDVLRRVDPKAAEQLALAMLRVAAERYDDLDRRVLEFFTQHPDGHPRPNEWATFRARLFEEPGF